MNHIMKICLVMKISLGGALMVVTLASAAQADEFKLSNNQRISCSRGLSAGKLNTATCKSYAYLFNVKTSEYFRCQVSLALTRDNKEVINVQTDGGCIKKPRIFETDSSYSFDATETEPPNTNSFFGPGGYSVWAADNTTQKVRGCITISSGLGSDISKCLDMTFNCFFASPLVGEGAFAKRRRMRGLHPRRETPHPSAMLRIAATLPQGGRVRTE